MSKNIRVDESQKEMILDFMSAHPDFAAGRLLGALGKQKEGEMWERLASMLNSAGVGATKTADKWMKTWSDWKLNVKGRASEIRIYESGTGGGKKTLKKLSDLELRLLEFIGWTAVSGLDNVQEAGLGAAAADQLGLQQPPTTIQEIFVDVQQAVPLSEFVGLVDMRMEVNEEELQGDGTDSIVEETPITLGKRKRINSEAKKPVPKDPYSQAAKSFESIEVKRSKVYEEMSVSLKTMADAYKSIATAENRKAKALERIASAKEKKYGIVRSDE